MRGTGGAAMANALLSNTDSLVAWLDLSWNALADEGSAAFGKLLGEQNTLKCIDLTHNRVNVKGATALAIGLGVNTGLSSLQLSDNPVGMEGARILMSILRDGEEKCEVDLSNCVFDSRADQAKMSFNPSRPTGKYELDLSANYDFMVASELHRLGRAANMQAWKTVTLNGQKVVQCRGCQHVQQASATCRIDSCLMPMRAPTDDEGQDSKLLNAFPSDLTDFKLSELTEGVLALHYDAERKTHRGAAVASDIFQNLLDSLKSEITMVKNLKQSGTAPSDELGADRAVGDVEAGLPVRFHQMLVVSTDDMSFSVEQICQLMELAKTTRSERTQLASADESSVASILQNEMSPPAKVVLHLFTQVCYWLALRL